jgi:phage shock protein E
MTEWIRLLPVLLLLFVISACQAETSSSGSISPEAFLKAPPADVLILDVRSRTEFESGHVAGAINVPHDELSSRITELPGAPDRPVVVYCERGGRAGKAATVLAEAGYSDILHLEGDMSDWRASGRPIETGDAP